MAGAIRNFDLCLLYTVFTKESDTCIGRLANDISGEFFTNSYQPHFLGRSFCPFARGGNALLHLAKVFGDVRHARSLACGRGGEECFRDG